MIDRDRYVPRRGDIVWLEFDPQAGHEQAGRRPAVVLSPIEYNQRTGLMLCCPVTSRVKGYPFEVALPDGLPISGVALTDQVRNLDWSARNARFVATLPPDVTSRVLGLAGKLLT